MTTDAMQHPRFQSTQTRPRALHACLRWPRNTTRSVSALLYLLSASTSLLAEEIAVQPQTGTQDEQRQAQDKPASAIDRRLRKESESLHNPFTLTTYKPNYLLPVSYNRRTDSESSELDPVEIKFQFSFKVRLWENLLNTGGDIYYGYTQQSYWQAYNADLSSPFRETNYEPELMWSFRRTDKAFGFDERFIVLGFVHQSNGRTQPFSRSWNRVYVNFVLEKDNFYFGLKPWYRIPEQSKSDANAPHGDDNPDIDDYMGSGELTAMYLHNEQRFSLMLRNNLRRQNKGAVQLDWSFPLTPKFQAYVQYFNGYGESLIDYNHSVNRIGFGVMLNNWL